MMQFFKCRCFRALPKSKAPKLVAIVLVSCAILIPYIILTTYSSPSWQSLTYIRTLGTQDDPNQESPSLENGGAQGQQFQQKISGDTKRKSFLLDDPSDIEYAETSWQQNRGRSKLSGPDRKPLSGSNRIKLVARLKKQANKKHKEEQFSLHNNAFLGKPSTILDLEVPESPRLFGKDKSSEVRQIVFVKVHKAASSTMQNILLRFAMARNLSVLLPANPTRTSINEITPQIPRQIIIDHPPGQSFDILCNHVIYNKKEIAKYIPQSAVRIGILRTPLKQALSALEYYTKYFPYAGIRNGFNRYPNDPINGFLQHPDDFYAWNTMWTTTYCFVNNRMSMDLGFDTSKNFEQSKKNKTKISNFIRSLENDFDLMLISDFFEESLVLLRRYLNWTWKEIIYVKLNVAKHTPDSVWAKPPVMNETAEKAFGEWNIIDIEVYDHFFPLFLKKLKSEHLIFHEVGVFKQTLKRINDFCLKDREHESLRIKQNAWTSEFSVTKGDCTLMSMKESTIVNMARAQQLERYEMYMDQIET